MIRSIITRIGVPLLALTGSPALASSNLYVTAEGPGVEQSSLYIHPAAFGATNVIQEDFNSLKPGYYANSIPFDGNSKIGIFSQGGIQAANQYGGANGTGDYYTVAAPFANTSASLNFTTPQRYFGFWLSALDKNNQLSFYSNSNLIANFSSQDVLTFIKQQPNANQYFGNPNAKFLGQDKSEPFAFLNFFAAPDNPSVTFDRIVFSNNGSKSTGFEADNFTIATSYTNTSGKPITTKPTAVPFTPSSTAGILILILGYTARFWKPKRYSSRNFTSNLTGQKQATTHPAQY